MKMLWNLYFLWEIWEKKQKLINSAYQIFFWIYLSYITLKKITEAQNEKTFMLLMSTQQTLGQHLAAWHNLSKTQQCNTRLRVSHMRLQPRGIFPEFFPRRVDSSCISAAVAQ